MKKGKVELLKGIIGLVLCLLAVGGIYYWEAYGRTEYTKKDVVVFIEPVKPLTVISEGNLKLVKREITDLIDQPVTNPADIIGKLSKNYIPANAQLTSEYFEENGLLPGEGEYIFKMPSGWIASMPSTLRRSDNAYLYPVRFDDREDDTFGPELAGSDVEPIKCLKIAFVRNQSNQEVESIGKSDRLAANSSISSIELIVTLEDVDQLNDLIKNGYTFIVMYR